jgi:hypothetical protein
MFDNSEILMIWRFWRVVRRPEALLLPEKKCTGETCRARGYIHQDLQKSLYVHQPLWYLLISSPTPLTYSAMKTSENTEEEPDDPAPADEGDV